MGNNKILVHNDCTQRLKALQFVQDYMMNNGGSNSLGKKLEGLASDAKIGMRGSLVTDIKHSTGGPWDPTDFDLDIFIQSDELYNNRKLVRRNGPNAWLDLDKALESGGAAAAIVKELKEQAPGLFGGLKNGAEGVSIKVFHSKYKKLGKVQMFDELR